MPTSPVRIATIRGIDVRMAPSWLLVAAAIAWAQHRAFAADDRTLLVTVLMGLGVAVLFTGSVLFHEVAHALEGAHREVEVGGITLFLLGGATALRDPDRHAADELAIAVIGPWSNLVLAAVFGLLSVHAGRWGLAALADVAGVLGWLNLGLAVFNLVPGAPLDGGRILHAAVWAVTGDRHRSAVVAAWAGVGLGFALLGVALWLVIDPAASWAALWTGLVGGYVLRAARMELTRGRLALWLARLTAGELAPALPRVAADATAGDLRDVLAEGHAAVLVENATGEPVGVVRTDHVDPRTTVAARTAGAQARSLDELPVVAVDDPGDRLVGLLDRHQPLVLVRGEHDSWLSCLHLIDRRIRDLRDRGTPAGTGAPTGEVSA